MNDMIIDKIKSVLDEVRVFLQSDGGDIEFVSFDDGIVSVKMHGACAGCASIDATLYDGIESILMDRVEEVKGIKQV